MLNFISKMNIDMAYEWFLTCLLVLEKRGKTQETIRKYHF